MTERDGAAVDVDPFRIGLVHAHPGQRDRSERLVDLEQVDVAEHHAAALEHPLGGRDWPVEVVVGLGADEALGDDPGPWPQAQRPGPVGVEQQHRGCAVRDLRGRARRVQPVLEHRPELAQRLQAGLTQALVPVDGTGLPGRLVVSVQDRGRDRDHLAVEPPMRPGELGQGLRAQAEAVDLAAVEAAPFRDALRGEVLVRQVDVP